MTLDTTTDECFIGLMSGTSVDGVDAALVAFHPTTTLLATHAEPWPDELREAILALMQPGHDEINRLGWLDNQVARHFASVVHTLLQRAGWPAQRVRAIGSHGQTVRHAPLDADPYTLQIGNPSLLAELTGITVVADFRRRDMAAGGQGAPLAPAFHQAFCGSSTESRAVVNIGGIANISLLGTDGNVQGFDTGPGNTLLDAWIYRHRGLTLDTDGTWGGNARVLPKLLQRLLADPYFQVLPPKSTGREYFHLAWLDGYLREFGEVRAEDVQATLQALTAQSIADGIRRHGKSTTRVLIAGGGLHNGVLLERLREALTPLPVESVSDHGIDPDYLEAMGFAWLAARTLSGQSGNVPAVTGAQGPRVLGGIYPA